MGVVGRAEDESWCLETDAAVRSSIPVVQGLRWEQHRNTQLYDILSFFWPQEPCSRGISRGKSDVQWRGGSCGFPWVEDYRSLRRFCVFSAAEARGALLGLVEMALVDLTHFAKVQTIVSLHLGKTWAWGTCV